MRVDFWAEAKHRQEDLNKLASREGSNTTAEKDVEFAVTVFKILMLIGAVFLSVTALSTLPPDLALISITLILFATIALLSGSKKIIQIFPRYHYYGTETSTVTYVQPAKSWLPFWRRSTCSTPLGHNVPVGSGCSSNPPPSRGKRVSWLGGSSSEGTPVTNDAVTPKGKGGGESEHSRGDTVIKHVAAGGGHGEPWP